MPDWKVKRNRRVRASRGTSMKEGEAMNRLVKEREKDERVSWRKDMTLKFTVQRRRRRPLCRLLLLLTIAIARALWSMTAEVLFRCWANRTPLQTLPSSSVLRRKKMRCLSRHLDVINCMMIAICHLWSMSILISRSKTNSIHTRTPRPYLVDSTRQQILRSIG